MRSIDELRDIRLPPPPEEGGAMAVAILLLVLAGFSLWLLLRHRRRIATAWHGWRAWSQARDAWQGDRDPRALALRLATVARERLAAREPAVAGLAGDAWRARLVESGLPPEIATRLSEWPYRDPESLADCDPGAGDALLLGVRTWLRSTR